MLSTRGLSTISEVQRSFSKVTTRCLKGRCSDKESFGSNIAIAFSDVTIWFHCFRKCLMICGLVGTLSAATEGTDILDQAEQLVSINKIDEAKALLTGKQLGAIRKSDPMIDAGVLNDLGVILYKEGLYRDAENAYSRAIGLFRRVNGEDTPAQINSLANLAHLLYESAQFSRAEKLLAKEITILNAGSDSGKADRRSALALGELPKVYLGQHKYDLAAETAENLIKTRSATGIGFESAAALGYAILGAIADGQGHRSAAEADLNEAISILKGALDPDDLRIAEAIANLGLLYAASGEMGKAEPLLEDAHSHFDGSRARPLFRRGFLLRYAEAESRSGHKKKARELFNEARSIAATSPATSLSQYLVDASAYRQ